MDTGTNQPNQSGGNAFEDLYQQEFKKDYTPPQPKDVPNRPMTPYTPNYAPPVQDYGMPNDPYLNPAPAQPIDTKPKKKGSNLTCSCIMMIASLAIIGGIGFISLGMLRNGGLNINNPLGSSSSSSTTSNSSDVSENIDLRNLSNEQLKNLGCIEIPDEANQIDEYKSIKIKALGDSELTEKNIAQLKYQIDILPAKLLEQAPRSIVYVDPQDLGIKTFNQTIIAFADCADVFITKYAFITNDPNVDQDVDIVQRLLIREFTLVKEFYAINQENVTAIINDQGRVVDLNLDSDLVSEWARNTGWEERMDSDNKMIGWDLNASTDNLGTTLVGSFSPSEDAAETMAVYVSGELTKLSESRVTAVRTLLDVEKRTDVLKGSLPIAAATQKSSPDGLYEVATYNEFKKKYEVVNLAVYKINSRDQFDKTMKFYESQFKALGWTVDKWEPNTDENGVKILKGTATFGSRNVDITITSYDDATGFAVKPIGTSIAVISGFDF